jgi:hypothetical protein
VAITSVKLAAVFAAQSSIIIAKVSAIHSAQVRAITALIELAIIGTLNNTIRANLWDAIAIIKYHSAIITAAQFSLSESVGNAAAAAKVSSIAVFCIPVFPAVLALWRTVTAIIIIAAIIVVA